MSSKPSLMLRSAQRARLEARTTAMQSIPSQPLRSDRRERLEARTMPIQPLSGRDGYWSQILEPALRLYKALHLGRQRPGIEVVHDEYHHRLAAFELVQLGQQRKPLFLVELVEDFAD